MDDLTEDLMTYLCDYAFENKIGYEFSSKHKPDRSPRSITALRMVFMNNNWPNKQEIPFQFAHEISHIINGDTGSNNFAAPAFYSKEEFNANKRATIIILEYCNLHGFQWTNIINFMASFNIPMRAKEAVKAGFAEYIGTPYNTTDCKI